MNLKDGTKNYTVTALVLPHNGQFELTGDEITISTVKRKYTVRSHLNRCYFWPSFQSFISYHIMITSIQRKKTALTIFKLRTLIYGTAV